MSSTPSLQSGAYSFMFRCVVKPAGISCQIGATRSQMCQTCSAFSDSNFVKICLELVLVSILFKLR